MRHFLPAVCYHPTTIIFIDDNRKFLQNISQWLNRDEFFYRTFDDPKVALEFLTKHQASPFIERCEYRPDLEDGFPLDCAALGVNIRKIHREMYNAKRFAEIAVIVIDYAMPGLNGLELCKKLDGMPFKKIILTGEADEHLAVSAFNAGAIDAFIRKDQANFFAAINHTIREMQAAYFQDLSHEVIDTLKNFSIPQVFLTDPVFIDFFDEVCKTLHPVEYYLTDQYGGFVFLDVEGNPKWLVVKNEAEMQAFAEFANMGDAVSDEVIDLLTERRSVPYFYTDEEIEDTTPAKWLSFMHPAERVQGKKDVYYCALITDPKTHEIGKVLSFAEYTKRNFEF